MKPRTTKQLKTRIKRLETAKTVFKEIQADTSSFPHEKMAEDHREYWQNMIDRVTITYANIELKKLQNS